MEIELLPSVAYKPSSSEQARRHLQRPALSIYNQPASPNRRKRMSSSRMAFKSPQSDNFPTPRANQFSVRASPVSPLVNQMAFDDFTTPSPIDDPPMGDPSRRSYDSLYDLSEDEADESRDHVPEIKVGLDMSNSSLYSPRRDSFRLPWNTGASKNRLSLQIPTGGIAATMKNSPVPPTPPPKIPISPAVLSLFNQEAPSSTAPPSLDGSLTSEQLASSEAPPTPSTGACADDQQQWTVRSSPRPSEGTDADEAQWDGGIQLPPDAMNTLQFFSAGESVIQTPLEAPAEMEQLTQPSRRRNSFDAQTPATQMTLPDLGIPSPGGFFSSLAAGARSTWCPASAITPSSALAANFYGVPFSPADNQTIEQVINAGESAMDGPPTAIPLKLPRRQSSLQLNSSQGEPTQVTEITVDYDENYVSTLQEVGSANFERTSMWLRQQEDVLTTLREAVDISVAPIEEEEQESVSGAKDTSPAKSSIRFSAALSEQQHVDPEKKESVFIRAFQHTAANTDEADGFTHREQRFEALQVRRLCAPEAHRLRLMGAYQASDKKCVAESPTEEAKHVIRAAKEQDALEQIDAATWKLAADKTLNGGLLMSRPAASRLARAGPASKNKRARVLDLGGQPVCDWAWECAREYPNVKVYSVVTKSCRQPSHAALRGPTNHRSVSVPNLWRLPFSDNYFDVISARTLHTLLKTDKPSENGEDEYDLCLKECMRCLKPGGYLEYSVLDSEIMRAGPHGLAMSVEFGFNLKTRGYDPNPTRAWLGRLRGAGFRSIKRAWIFLPVGPGTPVAKANAVRQQWYEQSGAGEEEPMATTRDAATITGVAGGLAWEKWMLKLQMEMGKPDEMLLEGVRSVFTEGQSVGAGWRCLNGYARKPLR